MSVFDKEWIVNWHSRLRIGPLPKVYMYSKARKVKI